MRFSASNTSSTVPLGENTQSFYQNTPAFLAKETSFFVKYRHEKGGKLPDFGPKILIFAEKQGRFLIFAVIRYKDFLK